MASGKALFPGSTVFQELALIFRTLGFPNEQSEYYDNTLLSTLNRTLKLTLKNLKLRLPCK